MNDDEPIILAPGAGRAYSIGPMRGVFKADGAETGDRYCVSEWSLEPEGAGPGAHSHENNVELFLVTEGTMTFLVGDEWIDAPAGTFLRVPAGMTHDFANHSGARATAFNVFIPGGFEAAFARVVGPGLIPSGRRCEHTFVRPVGGQERGTPARSRRRQRLRDRAASRGATHHGARLAQAALRAEAHLAVPSVLAGLEARSSSAGRLRGATRAVPRRRAHRPTRAHAAPPLSLDARTRGSSTRRKSCSGAAFPSNTSAVSSVDDGATVVLRVYGATSLPVPAARAGEEARPPRSARGVAAAARRRGAVGVPPRMHPLRRLRLREPDRPLRVPQLRLRQPLAPTSSTPSRRTCPALGCGRGDTRRAIRLNRREDVARLVEHVGIKG